MKRTALLIPLLLLAVACGGDDGDDDAASTEGTAEGGAAGAVVVSGSSTVEPISASVAEAFLAENPGVEIQVDGPGTGDGFELFCNGETDISDASRAIKDEEIAACEENGVEYVELQIAYDGISVMTSPDNPVECVTFDDLAALLGPEAIGVSSWSDANPDFPDLDLTVTGPGEESGTYDSFVEIVLDDEPTRPDYQSSPNDNVIVEGVSSSEGGLGWVGFAFAEEAGDTVKELEVDGGDGCVAPSVETIADGSYPISRPLFIYVNTAKAAENPAVAGYVDLYLSDEGYAAVSDVGYVPLPDDQLEATRSAWTGR